VSLLALHGPETATTPFCRPVCDDGAGLTAFVRDFGRRHPQTAATSGMGNAATA
jgi:hypothetical protein